MLLSSSPAKHIPRRSKIYHMPAGYIFIRNRHFSGTKSSGILLLSDENSRVNKEHEDESLQDVELTTTDVPNFDSYTTVFLGYPIWWQDASWVVNNFVKNNDFTGKTVIPFCTSSVSDIGQSGKHLEKMAGTGKWLDGRRFSGSASKDDVQSWISSLNL